MSAVVSVAHRFMPSAGQVQAVLTHRALPAVAAIAALLWLCFALAQGTWRLLQPASPAVARSEIESVDLSVLPRSQLFGPAPAKGAEEANLAPSNLNITLTGVAVQPGGGCALLVVQGQPESAYCAGEELTPGVRLDTVEKDRIVILRNGAREAVPLKDIDKVAGLVVQPALHSPIVQPGPSGGQLIDRRQLQQQLGKPEFLSQALIVPNADGGFLVRQIQPGSLYEKLGLRPGDVIRNVNGQALTSMEDVMRLYQQFGSAQRVLVEVQRQGRNETLYYDMR
ncbi:MAG TPA: type II secretion system protein N [Burkholderiales bacterium]|nr:type II secretion system protein N [Burkholderiales bacterium]